MEDESLHLGPNGGLIFAMEYFIKNLDWLETQLGDFDDDYILFDCPGKRERQNLMKFFVFDVFNIFPFS